MSLIYRIISKIIVGIELMIKDVVNPYRVKGKVKYFCVGRNKTGTTSLKKSFEDLGFIVGNQRKGEKLFDKYFFDGEYTHIINYCRSAEVFQDVPFSHFEVIEHIDKAYPNSKYILTIRDNSDQWYNSLTKFHSKLFGKNGRIPSYEDLEKAIYIRKGFQLNTIKAHGTTPAAPYDKEIMCKHYEAHNKSVIEYFKDRPQDLLVINLSDRQAYQKFIDFIEVDSPFDAFPWENKT